MKQLNLKPSVWIYGAVFLAVLLLHGTGHRYGLPYVENYDEARIFYNAAIQRGAADGQMDLIGYPPMLFWMHSLIQPLGESLSHRPAELDMGVSVGMLRALAVLANAFSAVLIVWIARRMTNGWAAGLVAAAAWATAPDTLYNTVIALTEPYLILTGLLTFALALFALYENSRYAALLSVLVALVGVTFKYTAFPVLGLGVVVTLWQTRQNKRWWGALALEIIMILATAALLFGVAGASQLMSGHPETMTFTQHGAARLLDHSLWNLLTYSMADQLRISWPVVLGAAIVGTLVLLRRESRLRLAWIGLLLLVATMMILTIAYITYTEGIYRYVAPLSPFIALSVALALWALITSFRLKPSRRTEALTGLIFGAAGLVWLGPMLPATASIVQERIRPDTRAALAEWSLPVLTEPYQNILQDSRDTRTFIRDRAGYRGLWHFQGWVDPLSKTPQEWVAENANWLMAEQDTQTLLTTTDIGRTWAKDVLFLKSFPPPGETWRGPNLWFYRLTPPEHREDVVWNGLIHLIGYDLRFGREVTPDQLSPGDSLTLTTYWRADAPPTADLRQFIHLRPAGDLTQVMTQADGPPVVYRPSMTWDDPQETLIGTDYQITLPDDLTVGDYVVILGLYDATTGARWSTADKQDGWEITRLTIR